MRRYRWILIIGIFIAQSVLCTVLAWHGSKFALIMLAVNCSFLAVMCGLYSRMLGNTLRDWGRALENWQSAQNWGMRKDAIMVDILEELAEYDEEAVLVHGGRNRDANLDYLQVFAEEDSAYIAQGIREELK